MLEFSSAETLDSSTRQVLEALEPQVTKVKSPPPGEINQSLWVRTACEDDAARLRRHLEPILKEFTARKNDEGGWAPHLSGTHRVNVTVHWPRRSDVRIVEITVAQVPILD